ncbi:uncharacterized protein JCM15063_000788 [Sporobolomyces koalae]|uniref:uncharacterized protein n=1 Tax=Sporobolomyces koalae TaxID=500713 RepID=UPI0031780CC3
MSFLKARPSRILNLLTALHDKWPDGPSAESWEDWHSEAIEVLQKYLFRLTQPEGLFDPKRPLALTDDYVFPAKEFLELEAALKALVNRHYRSVEEVVLEQLHSISSYFVDHNANMADMRQLVVETGWDQFQGFLIEQLRAKWHNLDIAQQYNLLNDVKSIAMAGQQPMSEVHHDRQVSHEEVLQGFLKDVIKLEYNIVEHGMVARNVWKQFERDFEKAKRENLAPQYEPDKYIYAFLTGALLRESSKFPFPQPRLGWKPEHQHSLAVHHLTRRKQAIYVD